MPLLEVFKKISTKENGQKTSISHKADKIDLEAYFFEVLPNYDEDRVYASDIKKVIQWYNILQANDLLDFSAPTEATAETSEKSAKPPVKATTAAPKAAKASAKNTHSKASSAAKGRC
jgi:hypothetical protein